MANIWGKRRALQILPHKLEEFEFQCYACGDILDILGLNEFFTTFYLKYMTKCIIGRQTIPPVNTSLIIPIFSRKKKQFLNST